MDDNGLVVWGDPQATYSSLAAQLTLPETRVASFKGSYLALRRKVDDVLNDMHSREFATFLPRSHHAILKNFRQTLEAELKRHGV